MNMAIIPEMVRRTQKTTTPDSCLKHNKHIFIFSLEKKQVWGKRHHTGHCNYEQNSLKNNPRHFTNLKYLKQNLEKNKKNKKHRGCYNAATKN